MGQTVSAKNLYPANEAVSPGKAVLPSYSTIIKHPEGSITRASPGNGVETGMDYIYQPSIRRMKKRGHDGAVLILPGPQNKEKGKVFYFLRDGNMPSGFMTQKL